MRRYAGTLFGTDKRIEDLLEGTCFADKPGCFVIRVKDACVGEDWTRWPELIEHAMTHTMMTIGNADCIQVKKRDPAVGRRRIYDSMQVTRQTCICRVWFGGDKTQKVETSSNANPHTVEMDKLLMNRFNDRI